MERQIRVTGKGKISVAPDLIRLNITAEGIYKNYDETLKKSAEETGILRKIFEKAGLDPKDLKTTNFNIDSEYETYRDKKNNNYIKQLVGYKYEHRTFIEFPNDNKLLGKVLYELSVSDLKVEFSIRHTVKDAEKVKNELLAKAIEDSKIKAEVLSKAAGVKLGEVVSINYSWGEVEIISRDFCDLAPVAVGSAYEDRSSFDIDIAADDIDVEDTVTMVWEIK